MVSLRSEVTRKVLNYFFLNPEQSLYVNELARLLALDKRNLVKKIKELERDGLLESQTRGNLRFYSIKKDYPLYDEYRKIVLKTLGLEDNLRRILQKVREIKEVYIYGSYASDKLDAHSDIDLLVVGGHSIVSLQKEINQLQRETGREINVVNMGEGEFKKRIKNKDSFIFGILKNKHIKVSQ